MSDSWETSSNVQFLDRPSVCRFSSAANRRQVACDAEGLYRFVVRSTGRADICCQTRSELDYSDGRLSSVYVLPRADPVDIFRLFLSRQAIGFRFMPDMWAWDHRSHGDLASMGGR